MDYKKISEQLSRAVKNNRFLLVVVLVGFLLRLFWLLYARPEPVSDFADYMRLAEGLLDHFQFGYPDPSAFRLPLYPFFLCMFMAISRSVFFLSLVNVLLSTATIYLAYLCAQNLFSNKTIARLSAWVVAVDPTFVFYSPIIASEHLCIPLLLLALIVATKTVTPFMKRAIIAGVLVGFATLTRGEGLFYLPVIAAIFLFQRQVQNISQFRRCLAVCVVIMSAFGVLLPWYIRNRLMVGPGTGLSTASGMNFYFAHSEIYGFRPLDRTPLAGVEAGEINQRGYQLGFAYIAKTPASIFSSALEGVRRLYLPGSHAVTWTIRMKRQDRNQPWPEKQLGFIPVARTSDKTFFYILEALIILSFLSWRRWNQKAAWVIGSCLFMNFVCYAIVFWGKPRYRWFPEMLLCMIAALGILNLKDGYLYLKRRFQKGWVS